MEKNIIGKVLCIEDYDGNMIMAIEIDYEGNIKQFRNCSIADIDEDYLFETNKTMFRLQVI